MIDRWETFELSTLRLTFMSSLSNLRRSRSACESRSEFRDLCERLGERDLEREREGERDDCEVDGERRRCFLSFSDFLLLCLGDRLRLLLRLLLRRRSRSRSRSRDREREDRPIV